MDDVREKIYCMPYNGGGNDALATAALMQDKNSPADMDALMGGMGNQWNNPFVYLVWMMFAQRMWGNDGVGGNGNVELNARINELQIQMQDYHNRYCVICRRIDTHTVCLSVFLSGSNTHKDVITLRSSGIHSQELSYWQRQCDSNPRQCKHLP